MPALIALSVFATVSLLTYALTSRSHSPVRERLENLRGLQLTADPDPSDGPGIDERLVAPALRSLRSSAGSFFPSRLADHFERKMALAGKQGGFTVIVAMWATLFTLLPGSFLGLTILLGQPFSALSIVTIALMAVLAAIVPNTWLNGQVRLRQKLVQKALPDAIDLLTTCVEAGLGLDAALGRVAQKTKGPLAHEVATVLNEQAMGRTRREALQDMAKRMNVLDLTSFVNVIVQAEQLGVGVAQVLRVQAQQQRMKRRQRAEEAAYKAPIKMIFPLVGFIFPSLFLVILGPAAIGLFQTFSDQAAK